MAEDSIASFLFAAHGLKERGDPLQCGCFTARSAEAIVLTGKFKRLGVRCEIATDDGSLGEKGLVTALLSATRIPPAQPALYAAARHRC